MTNAHLSVVSIVTCALLLGLGALAATPSEAAQQLPNLHQMACYGHNFGGDTFIDQGWGWHSLYWKECSQSVTFDDWLAYPPVILDPGYVAATVLNDNEADPNVFPGGDPTGGWADFLNGTWDPGEELVLAAALCIDRWGSPLYGLVDLDNDGWADDVVAIRAVDFSGSDPSTVCWDWWNTNVSPDTVAGDCSFFNDFSVSRVWYANWDFFGGYEEHDETGATFLGRGACSGFTEYVCDPPAALAREYQAARQQQRDRRPWSGLSGKPYQQCGGLAQ